MLRLDIARLKRATGDIERFDLASDLLPLEMAGENIIFCGPVKAGLTVSNTGSAMIVEGLVSGTLELTCGRCLDRFGYPFEVPVEETYTQATDGGGEDAIPFAGDFIDITSEALKSVIMSLPMKVVCSEDCPGLCPQCGRKLVESSCGCGSEELDPRMNVLQDLLKKK